MSEDVSGTPLFLHGRVVDLDGNPVPGAVLDVWQADDDGLYETQHPEVDEARLRAKYTAREDGSFAIRTVARWATPSRWTARSATSSPAPTSPSTGRRTSTCCWPSPASGR